MVRRGRLEAAAAAALLVSAASPFVPVLRARLPMSGAVSIYAEDQLQYFAWIREAAGHLLVGNRFDLMPGARTFLHPVFALSGMLHAQSGLPVAVCYLVWIPVAIGILTITFSRYVRRLLSSEAEQAAALTLALLAVNPLYLLLRHMPPVAQDLGGPLEDLSRELWTAGYLWGYQVTAIAVGLMPLVLLWVESWRTSERALPPLKAIVVAALIAWLHPWQGATLILTIVLAEFVEYLRTGRRPKPGGAAIVIAVAIPAVYYITLPALDPAWATYEHQNTFVARPLLPPLLAVLPLLAPALLAWRAHTGKWQDTVVRVWPLAALIVYVVPIGAFPFHAFEGLALPLSVMAVQGFTRAFRQMFRMAVIAFIVLLTVPAWIDGVRTVAAKAASGEHGFFVRVDERQAFELLARDRRPGGVLTTPSSGALVPYLTGREVYVGHDSWSPGFHDRARRTEDLFRGHMTPDEARAFVRSTHARFLLSDCRHATDLRDMLDSLVSNVSRFGCAAVYELRLWPDMLEAAGPPDA